MNATTNGMLRLMTRISHGILNFSPKDSASPISGINMAATAINSSSVSASSNLSIKIVTNAAVLLISSRSPR